MKKLILFALATLTGTFSFAGVISCKKINEATAEGYEAKAMGQKAIILVKGQKVADLVLVSSEKSPGGDQFSVVRYSQNVVNGYALEIKSGGFAGLTAATIFHGGVAGFMPTAKLNDCK